MKIETKTEKAPFTPVTLTVTFEHENELFDLWHRLNSSAVSVRQGIDNKDSDGRPPVPDFSLMYDLWKVIDRLIKGDT